MFPRFVTIAAVLSLVLVGPSLTCSVVIWLLGPNDWIHLGNAGQIIGFVLVCIALGNLSHDGSRSLQAALWFCLGLYGLGIAAMFGLIGYAPVVHSHHRGTITDNLQEIVEAMHHHADDHDNRFPPAAHRSNSGKPLLSWRVLLLPYLGEEKLYKQFRLDEPWDSDHNLALLKHMPKVYATAYPDRLPPFMTRFQVFVGSGAAFGVEKGPHLLDDFPDGSYETVAVAEARNPVPWTKPVDLVYSPDTPLPELGPGSDTTRWRLYRASPHAFGLAFTDGHARVFHREGVTMEQLRYLIVRNDGKGWITEP